MRTRIRKVLSVGLLHGHDAIGPGAWGCGAFGNHPSLMARALQGVHRDRFSRGVQKDRFCHRGYMGGSKDDWTVQGGVWGGVKTGVSSWFPSRHR